MGIGKDSTLPQMLHRIRKNAPQLAITSTSI
jgi:hypothetical protein